MLNCQDFLDPYSKSKEVIMEHGQKDQTVVGLVY